MLEKTGQHNFISNSLVSIERVHQLREDDAAANTDMYQSQSLVVGPDSLMHT